MDAVRQYSSRAEITSTGFVNEYHYGDFRGDPDKFLEKYFDAMVYVANWGTHRFMFRVPLDMLDPVEAKRYAAGNVAGVRVAGPHLIFDCEGGEPLLGG